MFSFAIHIVKIYVKSAIIKNGFFICFVYLLIYLYSLASGKIAINVCLGCISLYLGVTCLHSYIPVSQTNPMAPTPAILLSFAALFMGFVEMVGSGGTAGGLK